MKGVNILLVIIFFSTICYGQQNWLIKNPNGFDYYLTTEIKNGKIIGQTRDNALKDIVGGFKFMMIKLSTPIKYPEIIHFDGKIKNNKFQGSYHNLFSHRNFAKE